MAGLSLAKTVGNMTWNTSKANTGFNDSTMQGSLNVAAAPTVDATHANVVYPVQGTLGVGASITINLFSLTEPLFNQAVAPVRFYDLLFLGASATWSWAPGAVNGWNGFLSGTTPAIVGSAGDGFSWLGINPITISNGSKNVLITNTDAVNTLTYSLSMILGQ